MKMQFTLSYEGQSTDDHEIDFYDVAQGLIGFQRSLAITTHLIMNGEVITKAPFLKNAQILALPPEEGSWKFKAVVILGLTGAYHVTTTPKDTVLGHLVFSAYDYVVSETMGFHVNYDESLGQSYEKLKKSENNDLPIIGQSHLDSVIEKCEHAIQEMHRPIVKSHTASKARILYQANPNSREKPLHGVLTPSSYAYIAETNQSRRPISIQGKISSYNINTFKGRIYVPEHRRPIPFMLSDECKSARGVSKVMRNMTLNARERFTAEGDSELLTFKVLENTSRSGLLKSYFVVEVL